MEKKLMVVFQHFCSKLNKLILCFVISALNKKKLFRLLNLAEYRLNCVQFHRIKMWITFENRYRYSELSLVFQVVWGNSYWNTANAYLFFSQFPGKMPTPRHLMRALSFMPGSLKNLHSSKKLRRAHLRLLRSSEGPPVDLKTLDQWYLPTHSPLQRDHLLYHIPSQTLKEKKIESLKDWEEEEEHMYILSLPNCFPHGTICS